jgi:hypothetical protein
VHANFYRRVKCDRNHPCQNCTRRGQEESCTFLDPMTRKGVAKSSSTSEARSMRQRVTQLEGLLRSFIEPSGDGASSRNHSETASTLGLDDVVKGFSPLDSTIKSQRDLDMNDGDAALDESSPSPGQLTLGGTETSYVGSAHWGAILNEVSMSPTPKSRLSCPRLDLTIHNNLGCQPQRSFEYS